jgi:hypothetical protein
LNEAEFNRRVARGRPVTKWRYNPNEKQKYISKTPRRSIDINAITASVVELSNVYVSRSAVCVCLALSGAHVCHAQRSRSAAIVCLALSGDRVSRALKGGHPVVI